MPESSFVDVPVLLELLEPTFLPKWNPHPYAMDKWYRYIAVFFFHFFLCKNVANVMYCSIGFVSFTHTACCIRLLYSTSFKHTACCIPLLYTVLDIIIVHHFVQPLCTPRWTSPDGMACDFLVYLMSLILNHSFQHLFCLFVCSL